jgi:hypothetical protein
MITIGVGSMVTYWGIGATSSEFNKLLEILRLAGKLSSVVGHEGPLTSADGAAFNRLEIEKTPQ